MCCKTSYVSLLQLIRLCSSFILTGRQKPKIQNWSVPSGSVLLDKYFVSCNFFQCGNCMNICLRLARTFSNISTKLKPIPTTGVGSRGMSTLFPIGPLASQVAIWPTVHLPSSQEKQVSLWKGQETISTGLAFSVDKI